MNALSLDTVVLSKDRGALEILDQTLLPNEIQVLRLTETEEIWEAIRSLRVRGAPAIGVCAGYALALAASKIETDSREEFLAALREKKAYLASSRPTAVNLFWALDRMERVAADHPELSLSELRERLFREADAIREEDIAISRSIGRLGLGLLRRGDGILTHCNAGTLATAKYGTATAPIYAALEEGRDDLRVYCDETRPLLQGARLTAFEMCSAGADTTLLCDNAASRCVLCRLRPRGGERGCGEQDRHERGSDPGEALRDPVLCLRAKLHHRHVPSGRRFDPHRAAPGGGGHRDVVYPPHGPRGRAGLQSRL